MVFQNHVIKECINMAEKKTVSAADSGRKKKAAPAAGETQAAKINGNATGRRIGAIALWIVAIAFEVLAILILFKKIEITFMNPLVAAIILVVLDLVCVICGSFLWKSANRIDPASEKNKVKFWLWNNMGLIVTVAAFLPFIILTLMSKDADKKTKTIAVIVGVIALLIGGACSYEWNPISEEEKAAQEQKYADTVLPESTVYFTKFGKKYHLYEDCSHINKSDTIYDAKKSREDSDDAEDKNLSCVDIAIRYGCDDVCKTCATKFEKATAPAGE